MHLGLLLLLQQLYTLCLLQHQACQQVLQIAEAEEDNASNTNKC
jgi:hypothetical protein